MKHKWLKIFVIVVSILTVLSVSLCGGGSSAEAAAPAKDDELLIGASILTLNNNYYLTISNGIKKAVEEMGGTFVVTDAQSSIEKQIADVEDMIAQGADAIVVAPVDGQGCRPIAESCKRAGIPLICVNSSIEDDYVSTTIATNNYMAGELMGQALLEQMDATAKVGMLEYNILDGGRQRTNGFIDTVKGSPGVEIVARQECDATTEGALPIVDDFLQSNPEITAIWVINDPAAIGAYSAIKAANRTDIKIFSCDGDPSIMSYIQEDKVAHTSAQYPIDIGVGAVDAIVKVLNHGEVPKETLIKSGAVNKNNVDEFVEYLKETGQM
jgi:ribose transport system substrate-binding protein